MSRRAAASARKGISKRFEGLAQTSTPRSIVTAPVITKEEDQEYRLLLQSASLWGGTPEQVRYLTNLRYLNSNDRIIDLKHRDIIMEIIGMLMTIPFEEVVAFLSTAPNPRHVNWEQPAMNIGKDRVEREITIYQFEPSGSKSGERCRYCYSTEVLTSLRQVRSGDEPQDEFHRCVQCKRTWRT